MQQTHPPRLDLAEQRARPACVAGGNGCRAICAGQFRPAGRNCSANFVNPSLYPSGLTLAWGVRHFGRQHTGEVPVLNSIGGQNERWAQIAVLQPPPPSQPSQHGGPALSHAGMARTGLPSISPIAGSTASPLSNDTNFLLAVFGGAPPPGGRGGGAGSTTAAVRDQAIGQLQPLANTQTGSSDGTDNTPPDGITGSSLVQKLQELVARGSSITFASDEVSLLSARRSGSASGDDAIQNGDSALPFWGNGWDSTPEPSDGRRQQAGLAAYRLGDFSGGSDAAPLVLQGITA
jgi:hypothetical protein